MYQEERNISCRVILITKRKQSSIQIDLQINQFDQIDVFFFVSLLKSVKAIQDHHDQNIFYFDISNARYQKINDNKPFVNHEILINKENIIYTKISESQISDQLMANPIIQPRECQTRVKRNREKTIQQAYLITKQWRLLYRQGSTSALGIITKINLDQSAQFLCTPRKTLQDYYLLFRKGYSNRFKFKQQMKERIGVLRTFVRDKPKEERQERKQFDEGRFFSNMDKEINTNIIEEKAIFDVIGQGSDEDVLFQN